MKFLKKLFWGGLIGGAGYLLFSEKGKAIRKEIREKLPEFLDEVKKRCESSRKTFDEVVDEVMSEWESAKRVMRESIAPLKREIKRRMKK